MKPLVLAPWVDFTDELEGCTDVAISAALDGTVLAIGRHSHESSRDVTGMFAKSRLDQPSDYTLVSFRDGAFERTSILEERLPLHLAQPVAEGTLLVGSRCHFRPEGPEENALIVDNTGRVVRRMTLGDGIADVRTDLRASPRGRIWVSYFDEGVIGNYGWCLSGPEPIGSAGLVTFDTEGQVRSRFDPEKAGTDRIVDAYAMNLAGEDDAWVCFYTAFPLVRVHRGAYSVWPVAVRGVNALVVDEGRVMLVGDYEERARCRVFALERQGRTRLLSTRVAVDEDGAPLDRPHFVGVGANLYAITARVVRRTSDW